MEQQLATLIESDADLLALAANGDAAGILSQLNSHTIPVVNEERRSWRGVGAVNSLLAARITQYLESSIEASGLQLSADPTNESLVNLHYNLKNTLASYQSSDGINFADPEIQFTLDSLAVLGLWPADLVATVKALGVSYTSPAKAQFGRDLTADDVTAGLAAIDRRRVQRKLDDWKSDTDGLLASGDLSTWNDVKARMAATE